MAPSPLHGLNLVQAADSTANDQDLLGGAHNFPPEYAAQLDFWSNLSFQSDEPLPSNGVRPGSDSPEDYKDEKDDDQDEADSYTPEGPAPLDSHVNAVQPLAIPANVNQQQQVDLNSLLTGFGIDPFLVPQLQGPSPAPQLQFPPQHYQQQFQGNQAAHAQASLAQLLAHYPFAQPPFLPTSTAVTPTDLNNHVPEPAILTKKARVRKSSTTSATPSTAASPPFSVLSKEVDSEKKDDESKDETATTLSPAEDKRRRNTAASARFRLKKKEREAALERRAAELALRVGTLERECEALRRENGWLKGLVVGVTGAQQQQQQTTPQTSGQASQLSPTNSVKRKREENEEKKSITI